MWGSASSLISLLRTNISPALSIGLPPSAVFQLGERVHSSYLPAPFQTELCSVMQRLNPVNQGCSNSFPLYFLNQSTSSRCFLFSQADCEQASSHLCTVLTLEDQTGFPHFAFALDLVKQRMT